MEKKSYQSWTISDAFWEVVKDFIPDHNREEGREYKRKQGGGRKPLDRRRALSGIIYVLRTGCQWNAIPREYGSSSAVHRYFQEWGKAGVFEKIWAAGLERFDELKGIGWEWQSLDGCMTKAPLGKEAVGKNPTDRGKKRDETQHSR